MPTTIIQKEGWKCLKCGHEWTPRQGFNLEEPPIVCPKCNNPRWNMEKKKEVKE